MPKPCHAGKSTARTWQKPPEVAGFRHGTRLENRTRFCEMHNFFPKRGSNNGKTPLIEHRAVNIRNSYLDGKFDFTFRGLKPEINEPPEFVLAQRFSDEEAL